MLCDMVSVELVLKGYGDFWVKIRKREECGECWIGYGDILYGVN